VVVYVIVVTGARHLERPLRHAVPAEEVLALDRGVRERDELVEHPLDLLLDRRARVGVDRVGGRRDGQFLGARQERGDLRHHLSPARQSALGRVEAAPVLRDRPEAAVGRHHITAADRVVRPGHHPLAGRDLRLRPDHRLGGGLQGRQLVSHEEVARDAHGATRDAEGESLGLP
jgi:hypothetical protein